MRYLLSLLLLTACQHRVTLPLATDPQFHVRQVAETAYAVEAPNLRVIVERLGCGEETLCQVEHARRSDLCPDRTEYSPDSDSAQDGRPGPERPGVW